VTGQPAYFIGLDVLGDPTQFTATTFTGGPAQADAWLGVAPGTTVYPPCAAGGAIACAGVLVGATADDVAAGQAALAALAGAVGPLIVPTGLATFGGGWDAWADCSFVAPGLAWDPGGIVPAGAYGGYQLPYRVIFRRAGGLILSGFMSGPPLPPNWPSSNTPLGQPV